MPLVGRSEGTRVKRAPTLRHVMPHVMPTRSGSVVYFDQQLDLTRTQGYIAERNAGHDDKAINLFQIILCAVVRAIGQRPQLNRFVVGRRLYQRNHIELSFAVKKEMSDEGGLTTVKVRFEPADTLEIVGRRVREAVAVGRGREHTPTEKEMSFVTRLPRFLVRFLVWAQGVLDYFNLLPAAVIRNDPLHASVFLANLGSVGLEAAYHHLYDYGTVPLFATIGRVHKAPVVDEAGALAIREVVTVRYSYDERIADGFYAARSLELLKTFVEAPAQLEMPPA